MIFVFYHFRDCESGGFNKYYVEADQKPTEQQVINALKLKHSEYDKFEIKEIKTVKV